MKKEQLSRKKDWGMVRIIVHKFGDVKERFAAEV